MASDARAGLLALGVLDAPEVREAIAGFTAASAGSTLTMADGFQCVVGPGGGRVWIVSASPASLPFADGSFARIVCVDALRLMDDPEPFLVEAGRLLAPGGGILSIAVEPGARATRGHLVKAGFSWSESYEVMAVERVSAAGDLDETRVFATSGWIGGP